MIIHLFAAELQQFPTSSPHLSSKNLAGLVNGGGGGDSSCGSPINGLAERADSGIKAVSSMQSPMMVDGGDGEEVSQPERNDGNGMMLPSLSGPAPERMIVIPAGGYGKAAGRHQQHSPYSSPRRKPQSRSPSGAVSIDMVAKAGIRTPTRELDRLHVENRAPARFVCPISGRIMRNPVILGTGTTCDRGALERYLAKGNKRCPVTKRPLRKPIHLMPNIEMSHHITVWATRNAPWLVDKDGHMKSNDPSPSELQGRDPQYAMPLPDEEAPGAAGAGDNGVSRIESGKATWKYTNGQKVRPGAATYNINASAGGGRGAGTAAVPWQNHRGIQSVPRSMRRSRSSSRSVSPSKRRTPKKRDWVSTSFLALISVAYLIMFIMSLWKSNWGMEPLSVNPWFGGSAESLAAVGAEVLPLMEGSGKEWWRLLSAPFLPAGTIHFAVSVAGLWIYGRYAQLALPLPQVSVAGVYLVSALVGVLASANLNAYYVTCGALAGVCGLLGTVCIDQAINFRVKKLWNLQEWWMVALVLLLNIAAFMTISLMPLISIWSSAVAFLAGVLVSYALVLLPRVGRGKPGNTKWASIQIISALVVVLGFTAAVVGATMPTKLGENVSFLKSASCVGFGSMQCTPYGFMADGCGLTLTNSGNATISCPSPLGPVELPNDAQYQLGNLNATSALCAQYCVAPAPAAPTTDITFESASGDASPALPTEGGEAEAYPTSLDAVLMPFATVPSPTEPPPAPLPVPSPSPLPALLIVTDPATTLVAEAAPTPTETTAPLVTAAPGPDPMTTDTVNVGRKLRAGWR